MPSLRELQAFIDANLDQVEMRVESLGECEAVFTCAVTVNDIGYGNAVSGPAIMKIADTAFYLLLLAELGLEAVLAASSLNFNFLRKPPADQHLRSHCRVLKMGRRLIVAEMTLYSGGDERPVAQATGTYCVTSDDYDERNERNNRLL
jgi:uncharacterized protein (TIGR00369 family)